MKVKKEFSICFQSKAAQMDEDRQSKVGFVLAQRVSPQPMTAHHLCSAGHLKMALLNKHPSDKVF